MGFGRSQPGRRGLPPDAKHSSPGRGLRGPSPAPARSLTPSACPSEVPTALFCGSGCVWTGVTLAARGADRVLPTPGGLKI